LTLRQECNLQILLLLLAAVAVLTQELAAALADCCS
jgi:hypothetical protein